MAEKNKGSVPILMILMVIGIGVLFALFYILTNLKLTVSDNLLINFFETTTAKQTFRLTMDSFRGGLGAITSEAVFSPFDNGIPDSRGKTSYVVVNPKPSKTTTTSLTTTTSGETATTIEISYSETTTTIDTIVLETSYRKIPKSWVAETESYSGKHNGEAAWTEGAMSYPEIPESDFREYLENYTHYFLKDHLSEYLDLPAKIWVDYNISKPSFSENAVEFTVAANISLAFFDTYISPQPAGPYRFSYPVSVRDMYTAYTAGKKIVKGFDPGDISYEGSEKNFNTFIRDFVFRQPLPYSLSEKGDMEKQIKESIDSALGEYEESISGSYGIDAAFIRDRSLFRGYLNTSVEPEYRKKYDSYILNYTILVNITPASSEEFCCNWNPIGNISYKAKPSLNFLLNDTFLALQCDERHKTAIWKDHRDDYLNLLCSGSGSYQWKDITEFQSYLGKEDLLLDLDHSGGFDSYWNSSEEQWYRCGYSLGDVIRVDGYIDTVAGREEGSLGDDEELGEFGIYPLQGKFHGSFEDSSTGIGQGKLICSLEGRTALKNSKGEEGQDIGNRWLRCFDSVQDFRILSVSSSIEKVDSKEGFEDKYCCINKVKADDEKYICSSEEQKNDSYCCECFGGTWKWSPEASGRYGQGYCIGDGWCEKRDGESADDSEDCCLKTPVYSYVDPSDFSYQARLNRWTEGDINSKEYQTSDNECHSVCEEYFTGEGSVSDKTYPSCSGNSVKECDGSLTDCGESQKICSGCSTIFIERGCGDTRIPGRTGSECFIKINDPVFCDKRSCDYNSNGEGFCSSSCSIACGAGCQVSGEMTIGCEDRCKTESPDVLVTGMECNQGNCECSEGRRLVCGPGIFDSKPGDYAECNGEKYYCMGQESIGIYVWMEAPE